MEKKSKPKEWKAPRFERIPTKNAEVKTAGTIDGNGSKRTLS